MTMHDTRRPDRTADAASQPRQESTSATPAEGTPLATTLLAPPRFDTIPLDGLATRLALALLRQGERRNARKAAGPAPKAAAPGSTRGDVVDSRHVTLIRENHATLLRESVARDVRERAYERMRLL